MALRGATPLTFRAVGVCDAIDGSNAPPGSMYALQNLIPNPRNAQTFVPRPAAVQLTNFSGFTTPDRVSVLLVVGTLVYGMIGSARFAGKDEPFCYDTDAAAFITIGNVTSANCPATQPSTGDWEPPSMAQVGQRILITHPGYSGANKIGWIDTRSFSSNTATGDTHSNTLVDNLSVNPLNVGWAVGDSVAGAGIPAGTYIVSMTASSITLSQAATATAAGVTLTIASGTPVAPLYGAGDTNTTALAAKPKWVSQFNGRAWFAVNNGLQYTDSLKPWQITASTQALTLGDDTDVTVMGGMPLSTQVAGGVVQALIAFKGAAPYWQITGDAATSNLALQQVAGSVGTLAPLTVQSTPFGLSYVAPDGVRLIDPGTGRSGDPIGAYGEGVTVPFVFAINPSRMCSAFKKNLLRISVQNGAIDAQPFQEYWYNFTLRAWSGPHTFPADQIAAIDAGANDFIVAPHDVAAKLFESSVSPSAASTYTENGTVLSTMWTTTLLPENSTGNANHAVEATIGLALPASQALTIQAYDEAGNTLDTVAMAGDGDSGSIWNAFNWGSGVWGGSVAAFRQWTIEWHNALNFKQMAVSVYGPSVSGYVIGNVIAKVQATGYQGGHP